MAYTIQSLPSIYSNLDNISKEKTYLLNKGEKVLCPRQNKDFISFLNPNEVINNNYIQSTIMDVKNINILNSDVEYSSIFLIGQAIITLLLNN